MQETSMRFSAEEAAAVQRAMRAELGLGPEAFPLPAFVGMISDEIDQLRAAGRSDEEVAALIARTIGREVSAETLAAHYASRQARGRPR